MKEGLEDLLTYCHRPRRTILEVLRDFPQTTPSLPLDFLPDLIPALKSREFSVASSASVYPNEIHTLVAIVKYRTRLRKPRTGLCSTYMSKLQPGDTVSVTIKKGTFTLPSIGRPAILIGPGTGVAPLRAIIQERVFHSVSTNYLFFGYRHSKADFYFEQEMKQLEQDGNFKIYPAFSREDPNTK